MNPNRRKSRSKKKYIQESKWACLLLFVFFLIVSLSLPLIWLNVIQLDDANHIIADENPEIMKDFSSSSQTKYHHPKANDSLEEVIKCREDQMKVISEQLEFDTCNFTKMCGVYYGECCGIIRESKCPESSWLHEHYANSYPTKRNSEPFLAISVGCNKGFDAINIARMGMNSPKFDKIAYSEAMSTEMSQKSGMAGVCSQMIAPQFDLITNVPRRSGDMHCIEALPSTANVLVNVVNNLGLDQGPDRFHVSNAAISSVDGVVKFPGADSRAGVAGLEATGIDSCVKKSAGCVNVPMYSLQSYVNKFVKSNGPINVLSIDVEGLDFDVLFGAGDVLDRTEYIEFEYHIVGKWFNYHVMDAIRLLDGKGFTCYWAGKKKLWRITECYHEYYNSFKGWSNIACVHRSQHQLAARMEDLFLKTLNSVDL